MIAVAHSLAGICVVRNSRDLIGYICGHYLRIGLAHIKFIDDGSSDGTYELLCYLAAREPRISVYRVDSSVFDQRSLVTNAANELIRRGFSLILPFDADEFWNVNGPALEQRYAEYAEVTFMGQWINFVQSSDVMTTGLLNALRIKYSAPSLDDANEETITGFKRPFVCFNAAKIGFKSIRPVELSTGQHSLVKGPKESDFTRYEIFHLPFRSQNELFKRALDYEPRRTALRRAGESWQSVFHYRGVLAGRQEEIWRANSADRYGFLNCYGERIALRRDRRLQKIIGKGLIYFALRYGAVLMAPPKP
jgi:hypothetical protein